jgi:hypothetical protein
LFDKAQESEEAVNCNRCEKSARSIVALAVAGVDPRQCGFEVDEGTVRYIRMRLEKRLSRNSHMFLWWKPMQEQVPEHIEGDMFGLREFMEWFRTFDLGDGINSPLSSWSMQRVYCWFPYPVAVTIRTLIYGVLGEPNWMNLSDQKEVTEKRSSK